MKVLKLILNNLAKTGGHLDKDQSLGFPFAVRLFVN